MEDTKPTTQSLTARETLRRRLIMGGLLLVALNAIVFAVVSSDTSSRDGVASPLVEAILPAAGAVILPQGEIGVDLSENMIAEMTMDGVVLPTDEFEVADPGRGVYVYQPGAGRAFERWRQGNHTVGACFWDSTLPEPPPVPECTSWSIKVG